MASAKELANAKDAAGLRALWHRAVTLLGVEDEVTERIFALWGDTLN